MRLGSPGPTGEKVAPLSSLLATLATCPSAPSSNRSEYTREGWLASTAISVIAAPAPSPLAVDQLHDSFCEKCTPFAIATRTELPPAIAIGGSAKPDGRMACSQIHFQLWPL